jgi:hypothetical protein
MIRGGRNNDSIGGSDTKTDDDYEVNHDYISTTYRTFQQAAVALDLVNDKTELLLCFREAIVEGYDDPRSLRILFVTFSLQGFPTLSVYEDKTLWNSMYTDLFEAPNGDRENLEHIEVAEEKLLQTLADLFQTHNKTMSEFGLPEPQKPSSELEREYSKYNHEQRMIEYEKLKRDHPLNSEQQQLFGYLMNEIRDQPRISSESVTDAPGKFFFIEGDGGVGKTFLMKHIIAAVRTLQYDDIQRNERMPYLVKVSCSTGIATQVFLYHNLFLNLSLFLSFFLHPILNIYFSFLL